MKNYYLIIVALTVSLITTNAQTKKDYSIEFNANSGVSWYTSLDGIDTKLNTLSHPSLTNDINLVQSSGGNITFRIDRLGVIFGKNFYDISTTPNQKKQYYDGTSKSFELGLSYDIITTKKFSFTPYITFGNQDIELHLDYKFEDGASPTSLSIIAREPNISAGARFYFQIKSWNEEKLQLFINADVNYRISMEGIWRFDNMLVDSKEFNLSSFNLLGGVSLKYTL